MFTGWALLGLGLTLPLAQATEIEVNSISEELQIMADEVPRKSSQAVDTEAVPSAETPEKPAAPPAKEAASSSSNQEPLSSKESPASNETPANSKAPTLQEPAQAKDTQDKNRSSAASSTNSSASSDDATAADEPELPRAKSVDLAKPITTEELQTPPTKAPLAPRTDASPEAPTQPAVTKEPAAKPETPPAKSAPVTPDASVPRQPETSSADPKPAPSTPAGSKEAGAEAETPAEDQSQSTAPADTPPVVSMPEPEPKPVLPKSLKILGTEVPPSTSTRLAWSPSQSFEGLSMPTPVLVVNGAKDGPTVCLTAAIHGDELNGIEVVRRVLYGLNPKELTGAVIGVPIVNLQGFRRGSRYLTDRRDLNRYFPGNPNGSSGARIAHSFFNSVIRHCDVLVDLHTGSFDRINLPQIRADLRHPGSAHLTHNFGATVVLHGTGAEGTLRRAATEYGIPAVTMEAGGPMRLEEANVSHGVAAIRTLLNSLGMIKKFSFWGKPEPVYYQSSWVRVDHGGILFSNVDLGQKVKAGDVLGTVTDPITNIRHPILSTHDGRVIGMALNQVMLPGYAAYHIGIAAKDEINALPADDALLMNDIDLSLDDEDLAELTAKTIVN